MAVRDRRGAAMWDRGDSRSSSGTVFTCRLFPKGAVLGNDPGLPFSSCKGRQNACRTEHDGDREDELRAFQEKRVVLGGDLDPADVDGKDDRHHRHVEHMSALTHGGQYRRCDPQEVLINRTHDRVDIGRREEGVTKSQDNEACDNIGQGGCLIQKDEKENSDGSEEHSR